MRSTKQYGLPIIILFVVWAILTINLGVPWFGHHDQNGVVWSSAVRNFSLYGPLNLRLAQVTNPGPATPETYSIYIHHPPMITWVLALASIPFGLSEATARFTTACFTLVSVAAVFVLTRRLYGLRIATFAMAFYALTPMTAYFGRMPEHTSLTLAFNLIFAAILTNWLRVPIRTNWIALLLIAWINAWTAWSAMLYTAVFLILVLWLGSRSQRIAAISIGIIFFISVLSLITMFLWQREDAISDLLTAFVFRSGTTSFTQDSPHFNTMQFFVRQLQHIGTLATPSLVILAIVGLRSALTQRAKIVVGIMTALIVHPLLYMQILRNGTYVHDYYKIFVIPPLAILGAIGFVKIWDRGWMYRWNRPALSGLVLAWLLLGSYALYTLHRSAIAPEAEFLVAAFSDGTNEGDLISTNVPFVTDAVAYYSFRNIAWDTTPDNAHGTKYLFCPDSLFADIPASLSTYPSQAIPPCTMIDLRR